MDIQSQYEKVMDCLKKQQYETARHLCMGILQQEPNNSEALHWLGLIAYFGKDYSVAEDYLSRAMAENPRNPYYVNSFSELHRIQGNWKEAEQGFLRTVQMDATYIDPCVNLGVLYQGQGRIDTAKSWYERALSLDSKHFNCLKNALGLSIECSDVVGAERLWNLMSQAYPHASETRHYQGLIALLHGDSQQALQCIKLALKLRPESAVYCRSLGSAYKHAGQPEKARSYFEKALSLQPDDQQAQLNFGLLLLGLGDWPRGWHLNEARFSTKVQACFNLQIPEIPLPKWQGESLTERSILVISEQGLGDHIAFCRFAIHLKSLASQVGLVIASGVIPLLETGALLDRLYASKDEVDFSQYDCWVFALSIPHFLKMTVADLPAYPSYLSPRKACQTLWKQRVAADKAVVKVGLVWSGRTGHPRNAFRSCGLKSLLPLTHLAGVSCYSLQKGDEAVAQIRELQGEIGRLVVCHDALETLEDTAALVQQMDIVITVCTSVAHLSGALGQATWVLLDSVPYWLWLLERTDSPWYPKSALFRQKEAMGWGDLVKVAQQVLQRIVQQRRPRGGERLESGL